VDGDGRNAKSVRCDLCGRPVTLRLRQAAVAETMWRWYDCPHCGKPNFLRLAGQILDVSGEDRES
jgi:hypothetical protein